MTGAQKQTDRGRDRDRREDRTRQDRTVQDQDRERDMDSDRVTDSHKDRDSRDRRQDQTGQDKLRERDEDRDRDREGTGQNETGARGPRKRQEHRQGLRHRLSVSLSHCLSSVCRSVSDCLLLSVFLSVVSLSVCLSVSGCLLSKPSDDRVPCETECVQCLSCCFARCGSCSEGFQDLARATIQQLIGKIFDTKEAKM